MNKRWMLFVALAALALLAYVALQSCGLSVAVGAVWKQAGC